MTTVHTLLRVGVFMLLAIPVVQCQTGNASPLTEADKAPEKKAMKPKGDDQKKVDAGALNAGSNNAGEKQKPDEAKAVPILKSLYNGRLDAIDSEYANISLRDCVPTKSDPKKIVCDGQAYHLKVNDQGLKAQLKQFHVGDHLRVDIDTSNNELKDLHGAWAVTTSPDTEGEAPQETSPTTRLLVLSACALAILAIAALATRGSPLKFIVGMDNRYSNSKFQLALWFWVMISTYLSTVVFRVWYAGWDFFGGVSIPQNLLVLSGLSAITYGGAKAITTSKVNAATNPPPVAVAVTPATNVPSVAVAVAAPADPAIGVVVHAPPNPAPMAVAVTPPANRNPKNAQPVNGENILTDLVQNDFGGFDFGDFQMIVVTLVAVVMYGTLIYHFLGSIQFLKTVSLPDVDTTILAGFGLGQGAYLAKKAGGNVGTS